MSKKTIIVVGSYGAGNIGDEAILSQIVSCHKDHKIIVFSSNPEETKRLHSVDAVFSFPFGFRSFFRGTFLKTFSSLRSADIVLLGGGGLFQDDDFWACPLWAWQFFWAKIICKKRVFLYAVSLGPLKSFVGKILTKWVIKKSDYITLRDQDSFDICTQWRKTNDNIFVTADPAFLFPLPQRKERQKKRLALSLRPYDIDFSVFQDFDFKQYDLVGISMDPQDTIFLEKIPNIVIVTPESFSELLSLLSDCEKVIGMRYHFLLASILAQAPFIGAIGYGTKIAALSGQAGIPYIDSQKISQKSLKNMIETETPLDEKQLIMLQKQAKKTVDAFKKFIH